MSQTEEGHAAEQQAEIARLKAELADMRLYEQFKQGRLAPDDLDDAQRTTIAQVEWQLNLDDCHSGCANELTYMARRTVQLKRQGQEKFVAGTQSAVATRAAAPKTSQQPFDQIADPKARAKAEWEADHLGCRDNFVSEQVYIAARRQELEGRVNTSQRNDRKAE